MSQSYRCRVVWSDDDQEYAGLCDAFPRLVYLAPTIEEAEDGIKDLVKEFARDMFS